MANSIFVLNSDVYVAGVEGKFAMYWKNGVPFKLSDGVSNFEATDIYVKE